MGQADIISRIEVYLSVNGCTANSLARQSEIDPGNLHKMLSGKQPITDKTLRKISDACNISYNWLLTGEGEMINKIDTPQLSLTSGVPYYDEDFMLGFDEILPTGSSNDAPEYLINMPGFEKATLWCNASGHSMEPEINNGDIIALKRIEDISFLPYGDVYGIITTNGLRTIKRLGRSSREGYYRLIPTNKDFDEQEIPINKIALVFRVMGAMKAF